MTDRPESPPEPPRRGWFKRLVAGIPRGSRPEGQAGAGTVPVIRPAVGTIPQAPVAFEIAPPGPPSESSNPGPLVRGAGAWGRVRGGRDFLNGIGVRLSNHGRRIDSTATLTVHDDRTGLPLRRSKRSTLELNDGEVLVFPFPSIRESDGVEYPISIETDAEDAAVEVAETRDSKSLDLQGYEFARLATILDPLLSQGGQSLPPIPEHLERYLDRHIYECVNLRRYFFPRLVHLADAVGRIPETPRSVLAIGVGVGYQEAFLAGRFPEMNVLATDVERQIVDFPMPNLAFEHLNLLDPPRDDRYDLVFSIECLEHIEDWRTAFRHKAAMVRPGGYLYISVPFASADEQQDAELRRMAWEENEHYTPGFTFEELDGLFAENDIEVIHAANMFHTDVMVPLRNIIDRILPAELEFGIASIVKLNLLDLREGRAQSLRQAEGVRFLGRKRG